MNLFTCSYGEICSCFLYGPLFRLQSWHFFVENLECDCSFITHHTVSGRNLTDPDFLKRKDQIVKALDYEIKHGDLNRMAALRQNKKTL